MGLIDGTRRAPEALSFFFIFFLLNISHLFAQNVIQSAVPLAAEIFRLEKICRGTASSAPSGSAEERYGAFMGLGRLHRLSGNPESALKAYEGALTVSPGDGRALFEQSRLLISLGEYEMAAIPINAMPGTGLNQELTIQARYLGAMLEAFRSGNTVILAALADDTGFSAYRSPIYYTLWRLSGLASWKNRLTAEYPASPEAKIANGAAEAAATPLWLLFPGRNSITLASTQQPTASTPVQAPAPPPEPAGFLQTGLFSREENAKALADKLKKAGFAAQINRRAANSGDFWAVYVPYGKDMNAEIMKLKNAGFESFPVDKL